MKHCDYCGQASDDSADWCDGCGTPLGNPVEENRVPGGGKTSAPALNWKAATKILVGYFCAQWMCGVGEGFAVGMHGPKSDPETLAKVFAALTPALLPIMFLFGGAALFSMARNLVWNETKDTSPEGAAWVVGKRNELLIAFGLGVGVGLAACVASLIWPPKSIDSLGMLSRMAFGGGWGVTSYAVVGLLMAPPIEEMLFRGILYGGYRRSFGAVAATIISTLIFVLFHVPEAAGYPQALLFIALLAVSALYARLRCSAIGPAIAVHVGYNLVVVAIVICQL